MQLHLPNFPYALGRQCYPLGANLVPYCIREESGEEMGQTHLSKYILDWRFWSSWHQFNEKLQSLHSLPLLFLTAPKYFKEETVRKKVPSRYVVAVEAVFRIAIGLTIPL